MGLVFNPTTGKLDVNATVDTTGLALEAKQLADNHQVTVSNPTADPETGLATSVKQLADNHQVTVSNPTADPETGLATSLKQLANDHDVNVTNMIPAVETGLATSVKQLADNHQVTVSNPTADPETGLATSAKQLADGHNVTVDNIASTPVISGFATSAKQDTLLTELQLKADLTETQPVSAASLPLPTGAATSAKQLADNHQVTVSNPTADPETGLATSAKQLLDGHNVTIDNANGSPVPTNEIQATGINGGDVSVGTTAVELTFSGTTQSISIKSASTNTGLIWFGGATIDNTGANAIGELTADSAVEIELNDASAPIYIVSDTVTQKVYKAALT